MLRNNDLYEIICEKCGITFYSDKKRTKLCDGCKRANKNERNRIQNNQNKKPKVKKPFLEDVIPIREYTAIIERYNREHRTSYTYGQFVQNVDEGIIDIKKELRNARLSAQKG